MVHSTVYFVLDRYVTVTREAGSKLKPSMTTVVRFFPDPGLMVSDREGGGGVAGVTVKTPNPAVSPDVAVMVVAPVATPVANPVLETVAVEVSDDDHVTASVRSAVLKLE